jgi:hypothetical protein
MDELDADRMRDALERIIAIEDREWKPMRIFRSEEEAARDDARHDLAMEIAEIARQALTPVTKDT